MPSDNLWFQRDQSESTEPELREVKKEWSLWDEIKMWCAVPLIFLELLIHPERTPPNTSKNPTLRRP
jgi:hypothetical protein